LMLLTALHFANQVRNSERQYFCLSWMQASKHLDIFTSRIQVDKDLQFRSLFSVREHIKYWLIWLLVSGLMSVLISNTSFPGSYICVVSYIFGLSFPPDEILHWI